MDMPENTADDYPELDDLMEELKAEHPDHAANVYINDEYAHVFELANHRSLLIWQEGESAVEGYSTQERIWTGRRWIETGSISTEDGAEPFSATELREQVSAFLKDAEESHPDTLTPHQKLVDRAARQSYEDAAANRETLVQFQKQLNTALSESHDEIRRLSSLFSNVSAVVGRRLRPAGDTGPVATTPQPSGVGLRL